MLTKAQIASKHIEGTRNRHILLGLSMLIIVGCYSVRVLCASIQSCACVQYSRFNALIINCKKPKESKIDLFGLTIRPWFDRIDGPLGFETDRGTNLRAKVTSL
jgi:hypothetical protein